MATPASYLQAASQMGGGLNDLVSALGGIFGSSTSTSGSGTQRGSTTTTVDNTVTRGTDLQRAQMQELINSLIGERGSIGAGFSKQAAIQDAQGTVNNILKTAREQYLPDILGGSAGAGAYGSTTAQLLSNDFTSRAVAQGSSVVTDLITKYAGLQQSAEAQNMQAILSALGMGAESTQTNKGTTRQDVDMTTTSTQEGGSGGLLGQIKGLF